MAIEYFRKADARDPAVVDLFTDDVELFFPKLGRARGKPAFARFAATLGAEMERLDHDVEGFRIVASGDTVVVEGTERGVTRDGVAWPDGVVSEGRFCNVFEFDGALIRRMHVYVDPDFTSRDRRRVAELRRDVDAPPSTASSAADGSPAADRADAPLERGPAVGRVPLPGPAAEPLGTSRSRQP